MKILIWTIAALICLVIGLQYIGVYCAGLVCLGFGVREMYKRDSKE